MSKLSGTLTVLNYLASQWEMEQHGKGDEVQIRGGRGKGGDVATEGAAYAHCVLLRLNFANQQCLLSTPQMHQPNFLQDASSHGLGAALLQRSDGEWKPVAYASRSMSEMEKQYAALATVWACDKFASYIVGLKFHIELITSH